MPFADRFREQAASSQTPDGQAAYESARANFEAARPDIEAGKLKAYPNWRAAEVALEALRPAEGEAPIAEAAAPGVSFADRFRKQAAASPTSPEQAQVHRAPGGPMVAPPGRSPVQMTVPNVRGFQDAFQQAQVHSGGVTPEIPVGGAEVTAQPYQDTTMLAPRGARQATGELFQAAGRMALEGGLAVAGGGPVGAAAGKALPRVAAPLLKAGGSAVGSAVGSLLSETFDPTGDPLETAGYSAAFSGLGDGLALGFSAARRAASAHAAARPNRVVPGGQEAVELLGPGNLPSPGRLVEAPLIDAVENIVETSFTPGRIAERNARSEARAATLVQREVEKYGRGLTRAQVDKLVLDVTKSGDKAYRAAGDALYRELDGLAQEGVSTKQLVDLRNAIVEEYRGKAQAPDLEELVRRVDLVLQVPEASRGIEAGVLLDPYTPIRRYDPTKAGSTVIAGGDPLARGAAQTLTTPSYVLDNATQAFTRKSVIDGYGAKVTRGDSGGWIEEPPNAAATLTFSEMNSLRSFMGGVTRDIQALSPTVREGQAKRLAETIDNAMETSGAALADPEAFAAWRQANQFWKDLHGTFEDNVMVALVNSRPDDVFNTIMQADSPQQIARFRKMVLGGVGGSVEKSAEIRAAARKTIADPKASPAQKALAKTRLRLAQKGERAWADFQGRFFSRLVESSHIGASITEKGARGKRTLQGDKLLDNWNAVGADTLAEVFPSPRQRRNAERLFRTLEIVQGGTGSSQMRLAGQFASSGAFLGLAMSFTTKSLKTAATMLITPVAMSRWLDNEEFISALTRVKTLNPGSEAHARAITQLAIQVVRNGGRVVGPNGQPFELEAPVPKAKEAKELLDLTNRRR